MQQITDMNKLKLDEDYLLFIGYEFCQSGFVIGTYSLSGYFEVNNRLPVEVYGARIFPLPKINSKK